MFKITKDIYSVGVLNPNMRIFDIVMHTEYGTSYNSYIVKGEKIALIDGCHENFVNSYISNIEEITPLNKIDYLIVNHCEPDHTGALRELISKIPNIAIYCSPSSSIFLKEIIKLPLKIHIVRDGDTLSLGNKTLTFINAPFLHWPDSMFTYVKEEKTVFTCDFLGSHYCEPSMIDTAIAYPQAYKSAMQLYYNAIFSPFKKYVNDGLDKLNKLECQFICTSHGPILTTQGLYKYVFDQYRKWSVLNKPVWSIPIIYASSYGYTKKIAEAIQTGIYAVNKDIKADIYDANAFDSATLNSLINQATAFCLGSPTLNKNAVPPITHLLADIDAINTKDKPVLIFGSYGWSGEAQNILTNMASTLQLKPYKNGVHVRFRPSPEELQAATNMAQEFASSIIKA
ncbi:MAG: FprA family A-type flavoprotein [Mycoplasmataceae bacterium]|nr:FprA family A-type flavoprotein [Mycoplasmataceae bacterium]